MQNERIGYDGFAMKGSSVGVVRVNRISSIMAPYGAPSINDAVVGSNIHFYGKLGLDEHILWMRRYESIRRRRTAEHTLTSSKFRDAMGFASQVCLIAS